MPEYFALPANRASRIEVATGEFRKGMPAAKLRDVQPPSLPLANVWLGTSVEDNRVLWRTDHLRHMPAVVRFLSCEPLIGPLDLDLDGIHWVIVGGESGRGHRPIEAGWVRDIRAQAEEAGTAFFFKQWGGPKPKAGGRELDGRTYDEMPKAGELVRSA